MELLRTPPQNLMSTVWHIHICWHQANLWQTFCWKSRSTIRTYFSNRSSSVGLQCSIVPAMHCMLRIKLSVIQLHRSLHTWWKPVYGVICGSPVPTCPFLLIVLIFVCARWHFLLVNLFVECKRRYTVYFSLFSSTPWLTFHTTAKCYRKWECNLSSSASICFWMGSRHIRRQESKICKEFAASVVGYQTAQMIFPKGKRNSHEVLTHCSDCIWQIKSIERIIATLEQTIAEGAGQGDEGIRMEIAMLRNERAQLCAGFLGDTWPCIPSSWDLAAASELYPEFLSLNSLLTLKNPPLCKNQLVNRADQIFWSSKTSESPVSWSIPVVMVITLPLQLCPQIPSARDKNLWLLAVR